MLRRITAFLMIIVCLTAVFSFAEEETPVLSVGDKGSEVQRLKQRLYELGYIKSSKFTKSFNNDTVAYLKTFQRMNGLEETGILTAELRDLIFSDQAVPLLSSASVPLATPAPPPVFEMPPADSEGYLIGDGEFFYENDDAGYWFYLNRDLQIWITRCHDTSVPLIWFETDIRCRGDERFRTVQTDPEHPGKKLQYPYVISRNEQFVLGFSDDFFAVRMNGKEKVGIIIREGKILSSKTNSKVGHHLPNLDMMAQYPDGTFRVYQCNERTAEELIAEGAINVFSFGPILIRDGVINELLYKYYRSIEPRHAFGMIGPGHYLLLSVQGRTDDSKGTALQRVAEIMLERGVTDALNLDGGNTMALVFRGRMLNKLATYKKKQFVRTVSSLIGIGTTSDQAD